MAPDWKKKSRECSTCGSEDEACRGNDAASRGDHRQRRRLSRRDSSSGSGAVSHSDARRHSHRDRRHFQRRSDNRTGETESRVTREKRALKKSRESFEKSRDFSCFFGSHSLTFSPTLSSLSRQVHNKSTWWLYSHGVVFLISSLSLSLSCARMKFKNEKKCNFFSLVVFFFSLSLFSLSLNSTQPLPSLSLSPSLPMVHDEKGIYLGKRLRSLSL